MTRTGADFPLRVVDGASPHTACKARARNAAHVFEIVVLYLHSFSLSLLSLIYSSDPVLSWPAFSRRAERFSVLIRHLDLFPNLGGAEFRLPRRKDLASAIGVPLFRTRCGAHLGALILETPVDRSCECVAEWDEESGLFCTVFVLEAGGEEATPGCPLLRVLFGCLV